MPKTINPGRKARKTGQRKPKRYQKLREELQTMGKLPVTPEGAVKSEIVDPRSQGEQLLAAIVVRAARESWSTPLEKRGVVGDELVKVVEDSEARAFDKIMAANALGKLDQIQYERDNPEASGKAKGGVNVNNTNEVTVVDLGELFRRVDEQRNGKKELPCGLVELPENREESDNQPQRSVDPERNAVADGETV